MPTGWRFCASGRSRCRKRAFWRPGNGLAVTGDLVTLADGTGSMVCYSYDVRNRLKKVAGGRDDVLADYDYDGAGQIKSFCYGNGVQTKYSYRDDGELSSLVTLTE